MSPAARQSRHLLAVAAALLFTAPGQALSQTAVFVGAGLWGKEEGERVVREVQGLEVDTVLLETHFGDGGAIRSNVGPVFDQGVWAGSPGSLKNLKGLVASVKRVEIWFAGWGRDDYKQLDLVRGSDGATENLRNNLRCAAGLGVMAVCDDNESGYTPERLATAQWLGDQVRDAGLKHTIVPYKRPDYWSQLRGVDRVYLQMYIGGARNQLRIDAWSFAENLWPGVFTAEEDDAMKGKYTAQTAASRFEQWGRSPNVQGGFVWRLGLIRDAGLRLKDFSTAIDRGLSDSKPDRQQGDTVPVVQQAPGR